MDVYNQATRLQRRPSLVSIDLGTTFARAALLTLEDKKTYPVVYNKRNPLKFGSYGVHEMPAVGLPFENPFMVGEEAFGRPRSTPIKYFFYVLVMYKLGVPLDRLELEGEVDDFRDYAPLRELLEHACDEQFRDTLQLMLSTFFSSLRGHLDNVADRHGLDAKEFVLTIPVQWDEAFQGIYKDIIRNVWGNIPDHRLHFSTEVEAQAHFVFRKFPDILGSNSNQTLFVDFGGHTIAGCEIYPRWGTNPSFYMCNAPFSVFGGGELWTWHVGKGIKHVLDLRGEKDEDGSIQNELLFHFRADKADFATSKWHGFSQAVGGTGPPLEVKLSDADIDDCHIRAFGRAMEQIRLAIERLPSDSTVVVSGGSINSHHTERQVYDLVLNFGANKQIGFVPIHELSVRLVEARPTMMVCEGAALAIAHRLSIATFISNGALFALQVAASHSTEVLFPWPPANRGTRRGHRVGGYISSQDVDERTFVVCDPFFKGGKPQLGLSYDFCKLNGENLEVGRHDFEMRWDRGNIFYIRHWAPSGRVITRKLPSYFDGSSNCVFVDRNHVQETQLHSLNSDTGLNLEYSRAFGGPLIRR